MRIGTRHVLDRSFSALGIFAIVLMGLALVILLAPIVWRGAGAFIFRGTVEWRRVHAELFDQGDRAALAAELEAVGRVRAPVYDWLKAYEEGELAALEGAERRAMRKETRELREVLRRLLGPGPGDPDPILPRDCYGQTRWDRARVHLHAVLFKTEWDYSTPGASGVKVNRPRVQAFRGTSLEPLFAYVERHAADMLRPRWTFYWRFLFDESEDSHIFGGIWPEMLGTLYLTIGAMLFAVPMGVIAAIYLAEYAGQGRLIGLLRICISTLAGVPSIVFGLFGLAFFINTLGVTRGKSLLAGSLTLALLILPTIIRVSEEALRAVPGAYKEAALSLGAARWRAIVTVLLPAALPGILTGIVISMGRAAGETAPIIFTAAVSVGRPLAFLTAFNQPTPALPWNIYNLSTEHEAVDEIRHVQYGMVLTLVTLVLLLNVAALAMRARVARNLRG